MCNSSENCCGSNQLTFLVVQVVQIGVWELMIKLWGVDGSNP